MYIYIYTYFFHICILFSKTTGFLVLVSGLTSLGALVGQLGGKQERRWYCHSHDWWKSEVPLLPVSPQAGCPWEFRWQQFRGNLTIGGFNHITTACHQRPFEIWNGGGVSTKSLSKRKCCCTKTSNNFISISSCWRYQYQIRFSLEVLPPFCTVFCHFCSPCRCSLPLTSTHQSCFSWHISTFFDSKREPDRSLWPFWWAVLWAQQNWE